MNVPTFTLQGDKLFFDSLAYEESIGALLVIKEVYGDYGISDPHHQYLIGSIVGIVESVSNPLSYDNIKRYEKLKLIFFWLEMNFMFWIGIPTFFKTYVPFLYPPYDYSNKYVVIDDGLSWDLFMIRTSMTCILMSLNMMVVLYNLNLNKYKLEPDCKALFPEGKNRTTVRLLSKRNV